MRPTLCCNLSCRYATSPLPFLLLFFPISLSLSSPIFIYPYSSPCLVNSRYSYPITSPSKLCHSSLPSSPLLPPPSSPSPSTFPYLCTFRSLLLLVFFTSDAPQRKEEEGKTKRNEEEEEGGRKRKEEEEGRTYWSFLILLIYCTLTLVIYLFETKLKIKCIFNYNISTSFINNINN